MRPDTQGFAKEAQPAAVKTGKLFAGSFAGSFAGTLLTGLLQKVFSSLGSFAADAFAEAREAAKIGRLTNAVIKSTGGAARVTAKDIDLLSTRLSELAGVDDETVQAGTNLLLTFTKVRNETGKGNDIFNQATAAALDMSAAMNNGSVTTESFRGTILQIGKALNDPVRGMNALRRAGVTFDESQKKTIKRLVETGKVAEAQKIILGELRKEFGGAAAAATDDAQKANVAWANFKERIGTLVLPMIGKLAKAFTDKVLPVIEQRVIPALASFGRWVRDVLVPAVKEFGGVAKEKLGKIMDQVRDAWNRFKPVAMFVARAIGPAFRIILEQLKKAWDDLRPVLGKLTPYFKALGIIIGLVVGSQILQTIGILVALAYAIRYVVVPVLKLVITWMGFVGNTFLTVFSRIVSWFQNTFSPALKRIWASVTGFISSRIDTVVAVARRIYAIITFFRQTFENIRQAVISKIAAAIAFVHGLPARIRSAIGNLGSLLYDAGREVIQGLINGITSKFGELRDKVFGIARLIRDHLPFSPAKKGPLSGRGNPLYSGQAIGRLLAQGIGGQQRTVAKALADLLAPTGGRLALGEFAAPGHGAGLAPVAVYLQNHGVIGSQRELDNWLIKSLDRLGRERRL